MEFYKHENGDFVLAVDGAALHMTREEAEILFVDIGHVLQDDDLTRYADESGEE